jgi:hypothetical protein
MSEFARDAVLASVNAGNPSKNSLGGDLVSLTTRLTELDKLLRSASGIIGRVLGGGEASEHSEMEVEEDSEEHPREFGGAGS